MRLCKILSACSLLALLVAAWPLPAQEKEEGWVPLFNGKDLDNWERRNGTATYRVEGDTIVGKTSEGSPNSFLCTKKEYGDFELKFEVKVDDPLNSGVQIRSKSKGDSPEGRVYGPQVEIATDRTAGNVYGEGTEFGWLTREPGKKGPKPHNYFKNGEWNQYKVRAVGDRIQTWLNGQPIADLKDDKTNMRSGFIGLQVHSVGKRQGPYEVRWKNIYIKELNKKL